tara:strand:- start:2576 stop:3838 length:1263 start_codon:yes stop_codon:yes gene_type:complete
MINVDKNKKINFLLLLIFSSFLLRLIAIYFFRGSYVDTTLLSSDVNEWNILLQNLIKYKSYSFYTFDGQLIPSVYMPPVYPFFLYIIKILTFSEGVSFVYITIFIQTILSTYSVYLFYQLNEYFFSKKVSLTNSFIFSFFPINIYACGQISSITLQIFISLLFLKFFLVILKDKKNLSLVLFSIISAVLILTRGEFILVFIIIIFYGIFKKDIKIVNFAKIILIISLIISPYLVRNYMHFNQLLIVKSFGYNLWKGNNQFSSVQGYENYKNLNLQELESALNDLEKNKNYEINRDKVFFNEAKNNIVNDPLKFLQLFLKKILSFYFIDINSTYPNYYNLINIIPTIAISLLSFFGLFTFLKQEKNINNYLSIYLFSNLILFSIFFILPRYKLIIFPIQLIMAMHFIVYVLKKKTNSQEKK